MPSATRFDRVVHPEPLSVVACAFDQYIGSLVTCPIPGMNNNSGTSLSPPPFSSDSECNCSESQAIQESLQSFCQEDLAILAKHIPSLQLLVKNLPTLPKINVINEAIIHTLFRNLLQLLSSKDTPILFFLDDLQWADPLSLALLTAMVKGEIELCSSNATADMNKLNAGRGAEEDINVMFVGSYRDNEVDGDHPLSKVLSKFQSDRSINVTDISLSGFTVDTLNKMLSDTLLMPVRRVRSLSEIVIQKTDGQPLHVIEFVQALTADNLLAHSFERGWEWDADSIDICPITDSVAELFAFKLRRLPPDILLGLQIVSVFGSQVDQRVLDFVADYDGDDSVSILEAIRVGNSEGLVERASSLVSFSHDMIQKATIDSIDEGAIIALLRKLAASLIKNASTVNDIDSVLYVIVDLINRIGSDATPSPKQRQLFADLNSRAGAKAIKVPDFAGAAKYAENGISFLSDDRWETQYDLSLCLHEVAVLSHFSSLEGNRDQLMKRINAVFEHAKDFSDQFQTRCVWIKLLSMTDLSKAIKESLHALEQLGELLDLKGVDLSTCRDEMARRKKQFAGKRKEKFLSSNRLSDQNKVRAMKVYSSLIVYYHMQKSFLTPYISCQMIKITMSCGHCEHSVFGAATFASSLVTVLGDIDEGTAWGRTALSLMNMYERNSLIPSIHGCLYGTVFVWKEPIQATLEPLAMGIRRSFAMGNVEFAMINTIYYISRSFNCGKNIRVLIMEVEALARQHGNHFGNDTSSNTPVYSPLLQFHLTPLYNILQTLQGEKKTPCPPEEEEVSFPLDKVRFVNNGDILDVTLKSKQFAAAHTILSYETAKAFIMRDMDNAMKLTDLYFEHFLTKDLHLMYTSIYNIFYEALFNFHYMRLTGEEPCRIRGESAFTQMREWSAHSDWNFKNKLLLVEAELYYTRKDYARAAICYEASIEAAREHKFMNEEAMASELAGIFCFEIGLLSKAKSHYLHSVECFKKWGALAVCSRLESSIQSKFGQDSMQIGPIDDTGPASFAFPSKESCSKKRQSPD